MHKHLKTVLTSIHSATTLGDINKGGDRIHVSDSSDSSVTFAILQEQYPPEIFEYLTSLDCDDLTSSIGHGRFNYYYTTDTFKVHVELNILASTITVSLK